jgi:hypothetical protein
MTFWDGTRWVPEPTEALGVRRSRYWHGPAIIAEAGVLAAILAILLFALAPRLDAVRSVTGAGSAAAAGKQAYTLSYAGFDVWGDPFAFAEFSVTRTKVDTTSVWVMANCFDASGAKAVDGTQPYARVFWSQANPLSGTARVDSVKRGSTCAVWLARSYKSSEPAPGWPETHLDVDW